LITQKKLRDSQLDNLSSPDGIGGDETGIIICWFRYNT
jgi:hypothetical protein